MKNLAIILLSQLLCFQAFAWRESNGGNGVEAEAARVADKLTKELWQVPALRVYYHASEYKIIQRSKLKLNGEKKDAYTVTNNEGEITLIFIDEDNWKSLNASQKRLLVLHELTHFMFYIDREYNFSQFALGKLEKYKKLAQKYPHNDFPIEEEMISAVQKCNLTSFITAYLLVMDVKYEMETTNGTVQELVMNSKCEEIKNYAPLKEVMSL